MARTRRKSTKAQQKVLTSEQIRIADARKYDCAACAACCEARGARVRHPDQLNQWVSRCYFCGSEIAVSRVSDWVWPKEAASET